MLKPGGLQKPLDVTVTDAILALVSRAVFYIIILLFVLISAFMIVLAFYSLWETATALPAVKLDTLFEAIGFTTVIIISLSIEFLTLVFRFSHKADEFIYLLQSAAVAAGIALVFVAWSYFNKTSVGVEEWENKVPSRQPDKD